MRVVDSGSDCVDESRANIEKNGVLGISDDEATRAGMQVQAQETSINRTSNSRDGHDEEGGFGDTLGAVTKTVVSQARDRKRPPQRTEDGRYIVKKGTEGLKEIFDKASKASGVSQ